MKYKIKKIGNTSFLLTYNLVLLFNIEIKPNEKLIVKNRLNDILKTYEKSYGIEIINVNLKQNKVHIIFRASPTTPLSKFINSIKTVSSRYLKKDFPFLEKRLKNKPFWTDENYITTAEEFDMKNFNKLIKNS